MKADMNLSMDDEKTQSPWNPDGTIKKSNSARSTKSTKSTKSHDSLTVLGTHPFGSLRIHQIDDSPLLEETSSAEGEDGPPPLDPPVMSPTRKTVRIQDPGSARSSRPSSRDIPTHRMGGGDVVLIQDLPEVFIVGYDAVSFTAKNFGGVRDIPLGPHFFWVAHPDGGSARSGFWIIGSGIDQVHVMQWDKFHEGLVESARAEARIQAENLEDFHSKLVPYSDPASVNTNGGSEGLVTPNPDKNRRIWEQLTGNITEKVLSRVTGQQSNNWHVHTADRVKGAVLLASEMELDKTMSNFLQTRELSFSFSQHSKTYTAEVFGSDRTLAAMDATPYIMAMIDTPKNELSDMNVVGEFQFAYIVGMHLGNDSCIQQWWHMLLKLILKAYLLPERRPVLCAALLQAIATQLNYGSDWLDGSILDYGDSYSRDMRLALIIYKRRLEEFLDGLGSNATPDQLSVGTAFAKLEAAVVSLGWDIRGDYLRKGKVMMEDGEEVELEVDELQAEDERGEWAPEVVELDEHGRQRDLVSWSD